jgi:hypothetical protein
LRTCRKSTSSSRGFFPLKTLAAIARQAEPRRYQRKIQPQALVRAFLTAFVFRLSGLRAVVERCSDMLNTKIFNSLSYALKRPSSLRVVQSLVERLTAKADPKKGELIALDSMPTSLPKTLRHNCKKMNDNTVGGGVLWSFRLRARAGESPVQVHRVLEGAWHDSTLMAAIRLLPKGPIYLMDRGFYAFAVLDDLLGQRVRFIMRARRRWLVYEPLRTISPARWLGRLQLLEDAVVRLGGERAKSHPELRLVHAILPNGDDLIVVTNLLGLTAETIVDHYKQRQKIEQFHRFLKNALGLAHLYSFHQIGVQFLLHVALLLALLLYLSLTKVDGDTIGALQHALKEHRKAFEICTTWKRNMVAKRRIKKKKKQQNL